MRHRHSRPGLLTLISFSELPRHFEPTEDAEMLKNVVLHSLATARARSVLPVPGGPYSRMPCSTAMLGVEVGCQACITSWFVQIASRHTSNQQVTFQSASEACFANILCRPVRKQM